MAFWAGTKKRATNERAGGERRDREVDNNDSDPARAIASKAPDAALLLRAHEEAWLGWFWSTDCDGNLTYITSTVVPVLAEREVLGRNFAELFVKPEDASADGRTLPFLLKKRSKFGKLILKGSSVDRYWAISGTPQFDEDGQFYGFVGSAVDVTEQRMADERAARLAMYDSLTGLPNRLRFTEVLERILCQRDISRRKCAVLLIDLDRFKQVNDTLGHPAGDALLTQVADRLLRIVGDREHVFRLGGDEFQVILRDALERETIQDLAERIIAILSQPYSVEGSRCIIGASVGIACAPDDGVSSEDLVRNADLALYAAKDTGRGCAHFFSKDLLLSAEEKRILEEDLRDAVAKGEIHVFYQPIVNATTNCTTGVEALIRWHHPERGAISPSLFIPIAEEANLIGPLGEWILRKACEDAASWPGRVRVAVNVSPIQFTSGSLPSIVMSALASSGLSPERLELEITEGVFLSDSSAADSVFASLKELGVRLALDDFGTGYSSLGYLRTAPFDKIKIDQSFVKAATLPGSRNSAIIAAIVALADALGMETTAEGIESHDQLDLVRSLRVSHVQGYIYSQAVPSEELKTKLTSGEWVIAPIGPSKQRSERLSMFRKVRAIFGNHYRSVLIRNLSETGALVEGLDDVPFNSRLIIDFGEGHLVFANVLRSRNRQQGVVFEEALASDGAGGLRTKKPVSPYLLQLSGILSLPEGDGLAPALDNIPTLDALRSKLGLESSSLPSIATGLGGAGMRLGKSSTGPDLPSIAELVGAQLSAAERLGSDIASEWSALKEYVVPTFGHMRADQLTPAAIGTWLRSKAQRDEFDPETIAHLHAALARLHVHALQLVGGAAGNVPDLGGSGAHVRDVHERPLTRVEIERLMQAVEESANPQLKFIVSLLLTTRVRQRDLLEAKWDHIDLDAGIWIIPGASSGAERRVLLSEAAKAVFKMLPRWKDCPFVIANPATQKPYRSVASSWDTARHKAELADVEIDDLRYCSAFEDKPSRAKPGNTAMSVRNFVERHERRRAS